MVAFPSANRVAFAEVSRAAVDARAGGGSSVVDADAMTVKMATTMVTSMRFAIISLLDAHKCVVDKGKE